MTLTQTNESLIACSVSLMTPALKVTCIAGSREGKHAEKHDGPKTRSGKWAEDQEQSLKKELLGSKQQQNSLILR